MSDIILIILIPVSISNLFLGSIFLIRNRLENAMSMSQLDLLLKGLLFCLIIVIPIMFQAMLFCFQYRNIGIYVGNDGINRILKTTSYTISEDTSLGNHWILQTIFIIWLVGVLLFGLCRFWKGKKVINLLKSQSYICKDERIYIIKNQIEKELGLSRAVIVRNNSLIQEPFTTGILHSNIYFPEIKEDSEKYRLVLKHEMIHSKRHDCLYRMMLFWLCAFYWFNPFFKRFATYFIGINEMACDEKTLKGGTKAERVNYAKMLIELQVQDNIIGNAAFLTGHTECQMERRLKNMKKPHNKMKQTGIVAMAFLIAVLCPSTTLVASAAVLHIQDSISKNASVDVEDHDLKNVLIEETDTLQTVNVLIEYNDIQTRGVTVIDEDIKKGERVIWKSLTLSPGDKIALVLTSDPSDGLYRAGYIDSSGRHVYVKSSSGDLIHTFTVSGSGKYKVFIENLDSKTINVSGSINVLYE